MSKTRIWLIRHGQTAWSHSGAHTSHTDIPLTEEGQMQARALRLMLESHPFDLVLTSPMQRARQTCQIAGYERQAVVDANLLEWDYGIYEGRTTQEIRATEPGWSVWNATMKDGETLDEVAQRVQSVISRCLATGAEVALFAHGHVLRILAACWLRLSPDAGRLFVLNAGSVSLLGYERETRALLGWNQAPYPVPLSL
ncbi:MAG: phosphoglycerate mutase family protein [Proteobacteria bacterium]|nr:phosphoglycerate mutase family protein [Pseudomonadota bacterium]MDE3208030.1 histidine phosphatase family protein [Pseudomonadota bacterium]